MSEVLKLAKPDNPEADAAGFIRTETAEDILRSLALVRSIDGAAVTVISGAPGIGKTEALLHYERQNLQAAVYILIAKGEGNPFHVAGRILAEFGYHETRGKGLDELRVLVASYLGPRRMLLVDEAQNLYQRHKLSGTKGSSFGWLVAASDRGGFDLALCGDLTLPSIMMEFPHLQSRMRRPVVIKAASTADVAALAANDGLISRAEVDLLTAVAKLPGGLRNVENVIRLAGVFAGRNAVTAMHLKAAIQDLKLDQSGAK